MLIVPLMVVTVVDLVYSQNIVQNVNVTMNQKPEIKFRMLLLQTVSVMMRQTILIVTMMVVTVVEHAY